MLRRKHNINCIVEDCDTKAYSSRPVFPFPRCPETAKLWRRAIGIHPEAELLPSEGVCSLHFADKLVMKDSGDPRNMWLMPGAVPGAASSDAATSPPNHCRMCGAPQETALSNKVSVLRRDMHLLPVLDICLDLNGEINSLLPDGVCGTCISTVRYITKFAETCWSAQEVLAETYAPGKAGKVEPWKRLANCPEEAPENDPLQLAEDIPETKPVKKEEPSDSEMIELIPMQEVKQEISAQECSQQSTYEPEEVPQIQQEEAYDPPKPSNSKPPKKSAEPPAKRSRPSADSSMNSGDMYGCDFCPQKFAIKKHLDQHIRTHVRNLHELEKKRQLQVSQFRCLRCRAQFPTPEQLKAHFTAQHQEKIECRDCNMTFNFENLLEKHNAQMHPERAQKRNAK